MPKPKKIFGKQFEAPEGYELITAGNLRRTDLCWTQVENCWCHPNNDDYLYSSNIAEYFSVCRKLN